jgi:SPP1 family predicted phage head-tail adaptor
VTPAGALRDRLHFQKRVETDDGHGNVRGEWETQFTAAARVTPLKGNEAVQAQRLAGIQPYAVTVRYSLAARAVDTAWRLVDARDTTRVFDITAAAYDERREWIQILATTGGADD